MRVERRRLPVLLSVVMLLVIALLAGCEGKTASVNGPPTQAAVPAETPT